MDAELSALGSEPPEKRVKAWLKSFVINPNLNEDNGLQLNTNVNGRSPNEQSERHSTKRHEKCNTTDVKSKKQKNSHRRSSESDSGCLSSSTFRPYSDQESLEILNYIIQNDAYPFIKGNLLWQTMESEKICQRSWQSMKNQFTTKIYPNLRKFSLNEEDRNIFSLYMKPTVERKFLHLKPGERGWRKNGKYYSLEEDIIILKYILQKKRHLLVHGNTIWQTMEDKQILTGRSWQSMRSRYLKSIRHSLEAYELKDSCIAKLALNVGIFKKHDSSDKKQPNILHEKPHAFAASKKVHLYSSNCVKEKKQENFESSSHISNTKKKKKQDIRRYAVSASAHLASNLRLREKNLLSKEHTQKTEVNRGTVSADHETSRNETQAEDALSSQKDVDSDNQVVRENIEHANTTALLSLVTKGLESDVATLVESVNKNCNNTKIPTNYTSNENLVNDRNDVTPSPKPNFIPNVEKCAVVIPHVTLNEMCNEGLVRDSPSKGDLEYGDLDKNNIEDASICETQTFAQDVFMKSASSMEISKIDTYSITVEENDEINSRASESEDEHCPCPVTPVSLQSMETNKLSNSRDLGSDFPSPDCKRCSTDHNLSPSSN